MRYNLSAYHLPASNGLCKVTLKFCEPHYDAAGVRVFDVKLQGQTVLKDLDIFATGRQEPRAGLHLHQHRRHQRLGGH